MSRDEAIKELQGWRSAAVFDGYKERTMKEANPALDEALGMAIEALDERPALLLLIDWAEQCGFGYDNFPEEYEQYENEIEEKNLGYIEGMIYIAKKVTEGDNES